MTDASTRAALGSGPMTGASAGSDLIRVPDDSEVLEFAGHMIGQSSTGGPHKLRWVEITLYKVDDGTGRYVIHRVGPSRVYHTVGNACNRGVPMAAAKLRDDAVPCADCRPPARSLAVFEPGLEVSAERDHHGAVVCADAAEVLRRLRMRDPLEVAGGRSIIGSNYSAPALRLLDEARLKDSEIAGLMQTVRKL